MKINLSMNIKDVWYHMYMAGDGHEKVFCCFVVDQEEHFVIDCIS